MVNCPDGSVCNVSVVPVEPGAPCYEYKDCSTFPCFTEKCTLSPVLDVDVCIQSQCTPIQPIPPNPTSNYTLTLVICLIIPLIIITGLLVFYKKRNRNQPQPLNNDDDEINDDDEGNGVVSPRMSAIQEELDRPYPHIEHAGIENFTVGSLSDDDDYGPIVRPRHDAYDSNEELSDLPLDHLLATERPPTSYAVKNQFIWSSHASGGSFSIVCAMLSSEFESSSSKTE